MSYYCDVCLAVDPPDWPAAMRDIERTARRAGVGAKVRSAVDGTGAVPPESAPASLDGCLWVIVSDSDRTNVAEYLLDNRDYGIEAEIGLPILAQERLELLLAFLERMASARWCLGMTLALTDSDEIEREQWVTAEEFAPTIRRDCEAVSPPNALYRVRPPSRRFLTDIPVDHRELDE